MTEPDLLVVGRIGKPQGIRGEVTVELRTDDPEARFASGSSLRTDPADRGPLVVERARPISGKWVVHFSGYEDRTAAEALRGTLLLVDAGDVPPSDDPDEFHDTQLVGLRAELGDGSAVGEVRDVVHVPGSDLLVVQVGEREVLVPFVREIVPVVDLEGGRVVLTPPEGLLDL